MVIPPEIPKGNLKGTYIRMYKHVSDHNTLETHRFTLPVLGSNQFPAGWRQ